MGHIARCLFDRRERSSRFLRKPGFQCFSLLRFRWLGPNSQFIRSYAYKESLQESPSPPRIPLPWREGPGEGAAAHRIPTPPRIPHPSKNSPPLQESSPLQESPSPGPSLQGRGGAAVRSPPTSKNSLLVGLS